MNIHCKDWCWSWSSNTLMWRANSLEKTLMLGGSTVVPHWWYNALLVADGWRYNNVHLQIAQFELIIGIIRDYYTHTDIVDNSICNSNLPISRRVLSSEVIKKEVNLIQIRPEKSRTYVGKLCHNQQMLFLCLAVARRRQWQPTPVLLPGKSHGQRSLVGWSPWGC